MTEQMPFNRTVEVEDQFDLSVYEDNRNILWRTIAGIFVALALGWMVCRYKCSSKEPAPNLVQCCPKSLCKLIRLCFISLFSVCRCSHETQEQESIADVTSPSTQQRSSNSSILDHLHSSPPMLMTANSQLLLVPSSTNSQSSQPKRHPLRRESVATQGHDKLSPWTFQTVNSVYNEPIDEIRRKSSFYHV